MDAQRMLDTTGAASENRRGGHLTQTQPPKSTLFGDGNEARAPRG
jgi:hypothetical protein